MTTILSPRLTKIHSNIICYTFGLPSGTYSFPIEEDGYFKAATNAILKMKEENIYLNLFHPIKSTKNGWELADYLKVFYRSIKEDNPIEYIFKHFNSKINPRGNCYNFTSNHRSQNYPNPCCFSDDVLVKRITPQIYKEITEKWLHDRFVKRVQEMEEQLGQAVDCDAILDNYCAFLMKLKENGLAYQKTNEMLDEWLKE